MSTAEVEALLREADGCSPVNDEAVRLIQSLAAALRTSMADAEQLTKERDLLAKAYATGRVTVLSIEDQIRYRTKVNTASGCTEWTGSVSSQGYGQVRFNGKMRLAHRVVYELEKGPIQAGLVIDHLCMNRLCVNPEHLEPVTIAENVRRGAKAITHCPQGHKYTGENTRMWGGHRRCVKCTLARNRIFRANNRDAARKQQREYRMVNRTEINTRERERRAAQRASQNSSVKDVTGDPPREVACNPCANEILGVMEGRKKV